VIIRRNRVPLWAVCFAVVCLAALTAAPALGGLPPEIVTLNWCAAAKDCLQWSGVTQASEYRLYRGTSAGLPGLLTTAPDSCLELASRTASTGSVLSQTPAPGGMLWFLVTGANVCGEGQAGAASGGPRLVNPTGMCTASCSNRVKDGAETDLDCGGPVCQTCAIGKICTSAADCQTRVCLAHHCQPSTCIDGLWNDTETDVDCGGDGCSACINGKLCCLPSDCQTGHCAAGTCQP
jgi:hypothetical protein